LKIDLNLNFKIKNGKNQFGPINRLILPIYWYQPVRNRKWLLFLAFASKSAHGAVFFKGCANCGSWFSGLETHLKPDLNVDLKLDS
jgi:hypothetical protein